MGFTDLHERSFEGCFEGGDIKLGACRGREGKLEGAGEFGVVSDPLLPFQPDGGVGREGGGSRGFVRGAMLIEQLAGVQEDVVAELVEGWNLHGEGADLVVESFAEMTGVGEIGE